MGIGGSLFNVFKEFLTHQNNVLFLMLSFFSFWSEMFYASYLQSEMPCAFHVYIEVLCAFNFWSEMLCAFHIYRKVLLIL